MIHGSDKILEVKNPLPSTSTLPTLSNYIAEGTPGSLIFSRGSYPIVTVFETSKNSSMKQVHYNFEMDYKNVDPHQFSPYAQFFFY